MGYALRVNRATLLVLVAWACASCAATAPVPRDSDSDLEQMRVEQVRLEARVAALEERMRQKEPAPPPREPVLARPDRSTDGPVAIGVRHYRVPRRYLDDMLQSPDETMREARIVPVHSGGRVTGLRLFGIRPGTHLAELGFQNGDSLEALDDHPLTTPDQALEAYAAVRNADTIRVLLKRKGQDVEIRYDLVE
jgi:general secretion pathway protein C